MNATFLLKRIDHVAAMSATSNGKIHVTDHGIPAMCAITAIRLCIFVLHPALSCGIECVISE